MVGNLPRRRYSEIKPGPPERRLCSGLVTHSRKNLPTHKSLRNQPDSNQLRRQGHNKGQRTGIKDILHVGTWNIRGGFNIKELELIENLKQRNINIAVITETKKKLRGTKDLKNYTLIYSGVEQTQRAVGGVGILIDEKWKRKIESYVYINERIVIVRFKIDRGHLCVIGVYAPEEGRREDTEIFYEELQKQVNKYNKTDHMLILGDLNARVGNVPIVNIVGAFGEITLNENGKTLRDFATFNQLKITNTFFRKKDINKYTWNARGSRSIIDYVIANKKMSSQIRDTHVFRGNDISSDHFLVTSKVEIWARWKKLKCSTKLQNQNFKFKVHLLQEESIRNLYQQRLTRELQMVETKDNIEEEWSRLKSAILKIANEVLGKSKTSNRKRGLKIWNTEIANSIKEKQDAYKSYLQTRTDEAWEIYKQKRNKTKNLIKRSHSESWERFIASIEHDIHGRQNVAFKLMKHMNKAEKDTASINIITEHQWIQHYRNLWYDENCEENYYVESDSSSIDQIDIKELEAALKVTKNRKATGLDGINAELIKYGGMILKFCFLHFLNMCWKNCSVPMEWNTAKVISLFKKGNRNDTGNYRGITLLDAGYKIYGKILNQRLQAIADVVISEEQSGFRKGRSSSDNIFIMRQIIEKRREFGLETHLAFIDYEKAFDKVKRPLLWKILEIRGFPKHLISAVKSLYVNTKIVISSGFKVSEAILTNLGVRQGCSLSPTLFNLYIDDLVLKWKDEIQTAIKIESNTPLNTLLYADDQIIIQETEDNLQRAVYRLSQNAIFYNLTISANKTKIMAFKGKNPVRSKIIVNGNILEQVSHFNYLGCDISFNYEKDIEKKVNRFQMICGTIGRTLGRKARKETQMKFYKVMAVPTLIYGSESWTITKKEESRIQSAEMKFMRYVRRCTKADKIKNETIRSDLNIFSVHDMVEENKTKWKDHVDRMAENRLPKKIMNYRPIGKRDLGRPRKRWLDDRDRNR